MTPLTHAPTPVRALAFPGVLPGRLWMKDERGASSHGALRKLERVLAERGDATDLIGTGGGDSPDLQALAEAGEALGLPVHAVVLGGEALVEPDRFWSEERCVHEVALSFVAGKVVRRLRDAGRDPFWVPIHASSPAGNRAWMDVAAEVVRDVESGLLPPVRRVYLPVVTGGSAAGLGVGLRLAGSSIEVVGVPVGPVGGRVAVRWHELRLEDMLRTEGVDVPRGSGSLRIEVPGPSVVEEALGGGLTLHRRDAPVLSACLRDLRQQPEFSALWIATAAT